MAVEVGFEPTEGLPPHTLSRTGHGRPPLLATGLTRAGRHAAVADERPRTGVNETKTETTREALGGRAERLLGTAWPACRAMRPRTRQGSTAPRFPTLLACVHQWPPPSVTCANRVILAAGERSRTGVMRQELK